MNLTGNLFQRKYSLLDFQGTHLFIKALLNEEVFCALNLSVSI